MKSQFLKLMQEIAKQEVDTQRLETDMNQKINRLYNLTEKEIRLVESNR